MSQDNRPPWAREGLDPADRRCWPTHIGMDAAAAYLSQDGVPVAMSAIKRASESGDLPYSIVGRKRAYSSHDLETWLLSLRRGGKAVSA